MEDFLEYIKRDGCNILIDSSIKGDELCISLSLGGVYFKFIAKEGGSEVVCESLKKGFSGSISELDMLLKSDPLINKASKVKSLGEHLFKGTGAVLNIKGTGKKGVIDEIVLGKKTKDELIKSISGNRVDFEDILEKAYLIIPTQNKSSFRVISKDFEEITVKKDRKDAFNLFLSANPEIYTSTIYNFYSGEEMLKNYKEGNIDFDNWKGLSIILKNRKHKIRTSSNFVVKPNNVYIKIDRFDSDTYISDIGEMSIPLSDECKNAIDEEYCRRKGVDEFDMRNYDQLKNKYGVIMFKIETPEGGFDYLYQNSNGNFYTVNSPSGLSDVFKPMFSKCKDKSREVRESLLFYDKFPPITEGLVSNGKILLEDGVYKLHGMNHRMQGNKYLVIEGNYVSVVDSMGKVLLEDVIIGINEVVL